MPGIYEALGAGCRAAPGRSARFPSGRRRLVFRLRRGSADFYGGRTAADTRRQDSETRRKKPDKPRRIKCTGTAYLPAAAQKTKEKNSPSHIGRAVAVCRNSLSR
jgi:hypothetical protein